MGREIETRQGIGWKLKRKKVLEPWDWKWCPLSRSLNSETNATLLESIDVVEYIEATKPPIGTILAWISRSANKLTKIYWTVGLRFFVEFQSFRKTYFRITYLHMYIWTRFRIDNLPNRPNYHPELVTFFWFSATYCSGICNSETWDSEKT
jgi:hypothetical protein